MTNSPALQPFVQLSMKVLGTPHLLLTATVRPHPRTGAVLADSPCCLQVTLLPSIPPIARVNCLILPENLYSTPICCP